MNQFSTTGWTSVGLLAVSILGLIGLPFLSQAAGPDESEQPESAHSSDPGDQSPSAAESNTAGAATSSDDSHSESPAESVDASACDDVSDGVDEVRHLLHYRDYDDADALLATLLDDDCLDEPQKRDIARFQHAYLAHLQQRPETTLERLDSLDGTPPVKDYIRWLRADALEQLGDHEQAAEVFEAIYEADDSPLHYRARTRQSEALVAAERFQKALPIVEEIIELFPDYPRRHRALYHHARILDELQRYDEAAEAYQKANFEFPYKTEGQRAQQRLQQLAEAGHEPTPIDPEERFAQYRQLSVDKFWSLAHELMTELREEIGTDGPPSQLENEILQRIALNTYHSHDFETAAEYFEQAQSIYEAGHEDGFSQRVIYRYHNFALARLGRFDEARQTLETLYADSSTRRTKRAIAEFYARYGRYEDAYELYEDIYTRAQRRGWDFSYLTYKTGRFEDAYDNFRRLARGSRGRTEAKYLYWAARAQERAGNTEQAAELFAQLRADRPNGYYGLQADNRLTDLRQRETVDETLLAQADRVSESAEVVFETFDNVDRAAPTATEARAQNPRTQPIGSELTGPSHDSFQDSRTVTDASLDCPDGDCTVAVGLPFPTYGLTWNVGEPLLDPRTSQIIEPAATSNTAQFSNDEAEQNINAGRIAGPNPVQFRDETPRVRFNTEGRIYWNGRHNSDVAFVDYQYGDMIGPSPSQWTAYHDQSHHGGLQQAIDEAGELFPELQRAHWLRMAGWDTEARRVIRDVAFEFRSLTNRSRPRGEPHELSHRRWAYHIDNRRRSERADLWGMEPDDDQLRFPVPDGDRAQRELLERQQQIYDRRADLQPLVVKALQEVGDYHMVRQFALGDTWWLRQEPTGEAARYWQMAYPRAFPEQVIPLAEEHNVNPYMIWALMLVESSFNPDSISIADALGLLQVIPRTGLKIADLFGADDFGPFDLLEEQNSIEQGVFYFSKLVRKFHGQELLAFAGYNGGPHRVSGWLDMRGHDMPLDEFVEEITFDESRRYAKKVLRFLNIYLTLYEGYDDGLYVGQNLRTDYLEQPDF